MEYEDLGFRCGIEIHQRLDTDTKLFCRCPTTLSEQEEDSQVHRFLRPVPGESGEVDRAARFEFLQDREFTYTVYDDTSCLVELDEEPPHPIDREAVETALEVALIMGCSIPDEAHIMRKTVIDGSNTSGFQRTSLIGLDGSIETKEGRVNIEDIELEEESAGIGSGENQFRLDRLGIPLIEIGTDDSIKNPPHAKNVAKKIGMFLRSTGNVKRGIGSIRQDVNVSIEGGARVEIKGFQDVEGLDQLVRNEVERQKALIELKEELSESDDRNPEQDPGITDVTDIFRGCENQIVSKILESGGKVFASTVPLAGLMNRELCEGHTLGAELADYARAQGVNGMIHTDEDLEGYNLKEEFKELSDEIKDLETEAIVVVAGNPDKAEKAVEAVVDRATRCFEDIPEETRDAAPDFTTSYSRPLPGSARMYPETDIPPLVLGDEYIDSIRSELPETLDEKKERFAEELGEQMAEQLFSSGRISLFESLESYVDLDSRTVANFVVNIMADVESRYDLEAFSIPESSIIEILELFEEEKVGKDALSVLVKEMAENPDRSPEEIVDEKDLGAMGEGEVREIVQQVMEEKEEMIEEEGEHARGALMGVVMQRVGGKADGSLVNKVLSEELDKRI